MTHDIPSAIRQGRRTMIVAVGVGLLLLLLGIIVLATVARRVDRASAERESAVIQHYIADYASQLSAMQHALTQWDEAIAKMPTGNQVWFQNNLGEWMASAYGYSEVRIIDPSNRTAYEYVQQGKPSFGDITQNRKVMAAIDHLRMEVVAAATSSSAGGRGAKFFIQQNGATYFISAAPITASSGRVNDVQKIYIHVAIANVAEKLGKEIRHAYNLPQIAITQSIAAEPDTSAPLKDLAGKPVAYLSWTPLRPGHQMLLGSSAALVIVPLAYLGILIILWRSLRRNSVSLQQAVGELDRLAQRDGLTGALNRRAFENLLTERLEHFSSDAKPDALLAFDLDGFKQVNDNYGHGTGDAILRGWFERIQVILPHAYIARMGGDEFAVLVPHTENAEALSAICDRIITDIATPFKIGGLSLTVGVSIGAVLIDQPELFSDEVLRRADEALYAAKRGGKNRFFFYNPELDEGRRKRAVMAKDLHKAIADQSLRLAYQPIVCASSLVTISLEALLRWEHHQHGTVSPTLCFQIADEAGFGYELGQHVLTRAVRVAASYPNTRVAVNIAPNHFHDPRFLDHLASLLKRTPCPGERIELEVTEAAVLHDPEGANRIIGKVRELNIGIVLDDFGTGFSSISHLRQFALDKVKMDKALLDDGLAAPATQSVIGALIRMAQGLGILIVAEGVEDVAQCEQLRAIGCDMLQGFALASPIEENQVAAWLAAHGSTAKDQHARPRTARPA